jgi:Glycosyltransferases, probably involved in cell wall biogenesis
MVLEIFITIISNYYFIMSLFGIIKPSKKGKDLSPSTRFAAIVAAHNEEQVIGGIIDSLKNADYPSDLLDIYIIADNCSDRTAAIARKMGVNVCERKDTTIKGKSFALKWMFEKIFRMEKKYDALAIFDADNLVSKGFFKEMNNRFLTGSKVVQGYVDVKNPYDTWITGSYSIGFWTSNRFFQLSRQNIKLSGQLNGTGFCIDTELLKEIGWEAESLTEDLEMSCRLVLNGYKVDWCFDAVVYDEKPLYLIDSLRQRKRWMQGYADVFCKYYFKLIKKSIVNFDFKSFDCSMYVFQPFTVLLFTAVSIISLLVPIGATGIEAVVNSNFIGITLKILGTLQYIYTPIILLLDRKFNFKIILCFIIYPLYMATWIPITIAGIIDKNKKYWEKTAHTRNMSINEMKAS